jgi:hypothetical protein
MMPRHDLAPVVDDEVVRLARRFRKEAVASLVATLRDDRAPASAKASASATLLSYSDGKPGMARQISVADIGQMTPALRQELLHALLVHFQTELPAQFQALLKSAVDDAVAQARLTFAKPKPAKPCRFIRQAPVPEAVPPNMLTLGATAPEPPAADPPEAAIRSDLSGISVAPPGSTPETARPPLSAPRSPSGGASDEAFSNLANRSNVVTLPGTRREHPFSQNCDNDRPALMTKARPPHRP